MDGDLVLNIAVDHDTLSKPATYKKSGRWTDRLKAKRVAKRKSRLEETPATHLASTNGDHRPSKRSRKEPTAVTLAPSSNKRPTHIISSLFSYNPKVEEVSSAPHRPSGLPSNAPLADSSTFSGLGLDPLVSTHLTTKMKIAKPTAIQRSALQALLPGAAQQSLERDVFIQAQTGSGKTLSFLLPIIHDLLPLSSLSYIDRSIGTLALIVAPTRELAKQISDVLEALVQLRLRPEDSDETADDSTRRTRWLVSGLLSGGATRNHEKARLRKGIPILVSTPGRLLDHLQNTSSFNVGKCRWLVLDEADRLMDLGFEETITGIIQGLDGRRRLALQAVEAGKSTEVGGWDWDRGRRTILCSATIREDVQKLAGTALTNPLMVKAAELDTPLIESGPAQDGTMIIPTDPEKFTPPSQLSQRYIVVPLKLRLVALIALLRFLAQPQSRCGIKIVVFFSSTDSVDFHWHLLRGSTMDESDEISSSENASNINEDATGSTQKERVAAVCSLLPDTLVYRLHGSLPMPIRKASLHAFSGTSLVKRKGYSSTSSSSILLCTSVASRGLDLPHVRAVIQYDLPTEGGATEYVHRVGRTARAGKGGEAWSFVAPSEAEWVGWVESKMQAYQNDSVDLKKNHEQNITLTAVGMETILMSGFGGQRTDYEQRATEVQLSFERWVLRNKVIADLARNAFLSHMRAYSTHPSNEKHIFHVRHLHIGHLAKAFALRDAPTTVTGGGTKRTNHRPKTTGEDVRNRNASIAKGKPDHGNAAERRMQTAVRSQGRLSKKGGVMLSSGSSEFQIAGGSSLEKMVHVPHV